MNIAHFPIWRIACLGMFFFYQSLQIECNQLLNWLTEFHFFYSTSVGCAWEYITIENIDFDKTWNVVKEIILQNFAGDPIEGVPSPSVQNTIYLSQKDILAAIKEVNNHMLYYRIFNCCSHHNIIRAHYIYCKYWICSIQFY